jgi:hypothetical protein
MAPRSRCRACCREVSQRHYQQQKARYIERNRRTTPRLRQRSAVFVQQFLRQHPCARCGERDTVVLEFNHRDASSKLANVSDLIRVGGSLARLEAEIARCEDLCANWHQRHTIRAKPAHYKVSASASAPSWRVKANSRNATIVLEHLRGAKCVDCGVSDPLVLQFDHRPGQSKLKDIGWFVSSGSRASLLLDELARCDVRCANCHRRRTAQQLGWFRARSTSPA